MPSREDLLDAARAVARAAGRILRERFGQRRTIALKGPVDLVTDADTAAEAAALGELRRRHPDHAVLAEEGGAAEGAAPYRWYIDPLDGTTNYAHGVPHFCVSVACEEQGAGIVAGCILDPLRGEEFFALRGGGAWLGGEWPGGGQMQAERLRVSGEQSIEKCVLTTGFPYDLRRRPEELLALFAAFTRTAFATRRLGSAALDLAYVAAGRFDGFWESGLAPWDVAAGMLLVEEAGGKVSDYAGGPARVDGREIVASNGRIHAAMLGILARIRSNPA